MKKRTLAGLIACITLSTGAMGKVIEIEDPVFNANSALITNPYWRLFVTATYGYRAITRDGCEFNKLSVTNQTRVVQPEPGVFVTTRVVRDLAWESELDDDGECDLESAELVEDTIDFYAQDVDGNIWYFGEETFAKEEDDDDCEIIPDGAWEAGIPGEEGEPAKAGIVMLADPQPGDRYQQEYLPGEAEDWGAVLRLNSSVTIELDTYHNCLVTKEWTPVAPGEVEHKYYCPSSGPYYGFTPGLVYIEELKGKTVKVEFIGNGYIGDFPAGLPGDGQPFPAAALACD